MCALHAELTSNVPGLHVGEMAFEAQPRDGMDVFIGAAPYHRHHHHHPICTPTYLAPPPSSYPHTTGGCTVVTGGGCNDDTGGGCTVVAALLSRVVAALFWRTVVTGGRRTVLAALLSLVVAALSSLLSRLVAALLSCGRCGYQHDKLGGAIIIIIIIIIIITLSPPHLTLFADIIIVNEFPISTPTRTVRRYHHRQRIPYLHPNSHCSPTITVHLALFADPLRIWGYM